jgi:tetratricopeptide (TPR) repeat protein
MAGGWIVRRPVMAVLAWVMLGNMQTAAAQPQKPDDFAQRIAVVNKLYDQGKYAEGIPMAERAVALARQRYGEEDGNFASAIAWLAYFYRAQGRLGEAEQLFKRSLAIIERVKKPYHPDLGAALTNLATVYMEQGRYGGRRAATPRPSHSTSARSPSSRGRWDPTTPMSAIRSTTWPSCTGRRAATLRPSRS